MNFYSFSPIVFSIIFFSSIQTINAQNQQAPSKTPSGLVYKIFPGKGGEKPKAGELIKFHLEYTIAANDSVLNSSFGKIPAYAAIDTGSNSEYTFMEIIPKMSVGDSTEILISIDSLKKKNIISDYDLVLTKGGTIKCRLKLLQIFKSDSAVNADYQKETELEQAREITDIEKYLAQHNIKAEKTTNGAYVSVTKPGDATLKGGPGKLVSIKYKGYLFDGTVFDTNMDSSKGHTDPIEVVLGNQQVIQGWEETLPYFGKGGEGKIFVPAMLGYGPQGNEPAIPPFSNLIFDVQVLDVKISSQPTGNNQ